MEQAKLLRDIDILLTVKGAGETNIAWMKPCSIVLEISPWGYYVPHYYFKLSKRSGLLHYAWQVQRKDTGMNKLFINRPECGPKMNYIETLANKNISIVNQECLKDIVCRSCAKNIDGVVLNANALRARILSAMEDRKTCIRNHPFLSSPPKNK